MRRTIQKPIKTVTVPTLDIIKYTALVSKIVLKPTERKWINDNRPAIQKVLSQQIAADMAVIFTQQNPQLRQKTLLRPEFYKSLNRVAQLTAQAIVEVVKLPNHEQDSADENNKKEFTKKLFFAHKKWAAIFEALRKENQIKEYHKKLRKLLKYLAYKEAKEAASAAYIADPNNQSDESNLSQPKPIPSSLDFLGTSTPKSVTAVQLRTCLWLLGLKPGANHQDIKNAFLEFTQDFAKISNPNAEQHAEFDDVFAAHNILLANDEARLLNLSKEIQEELATKPITDDELKSFNQKLQLKPDQQYRLSDLEAKVIEYGIIQAGNPNENSQNQMYSIENTFEKLAAIKNDEKDPIVNISRGFPTSPEEKPATASSTPRLVMGHS